MKVYHSSKRHDWETPPDLFEVLDREFNFDLDAAASDTNTLCSNWISAEEDALRREWFGKRIFCNPPYGQTVSKWLEKGRREAERHEVHGVVMLVAARPATNYWWDHIWGHAIQVRWLLGRIKFRLDGVPQQTAPFESAIVIYGKRWAGQTTQSLAWDWRTGVFR